MIGTLSADDGSFAVTVTAATPRPIRLSFANVPSADALRVELDAEIPHAGYYNDMHGTPAWRRHVTEQFAEEVRGELAKNAASAP